MVNGFITIHRKMLKWRWYQKSEMVHLFIHLLLSANHEKGEWQGYILERGQLITGRLSLSENTGISQQTVRTCLTRLKSTNEITIKSTNKFSIITIVNYNQYQDKKEKSTNKSTSKLTNNQPTTNQQLTTNNNVNNDNNENNIHITSEPSSPVNQIMDIFYKINPALNWGNKTQRGAIDWMVNKFGIEEVVKMAEYACSVQGEQYAPVITTPLQFKDKLAQLKIYHEKNQANKLIKI